MSELGELYQALILDHNKNPRNFGRVDNPTHIADGHNPLCGDRYTVTVEIADGIVKDVRFEGSGCAISKASASLMTQTVKGKTTQEATRLFEQFHGVVTGELEGSEELGKLAVFAGVSEYPMRVKCATLSWHAMRGALDGDDNVTTE